MNYFIGSELSCLHLLAKTAYIEQLGLWLENRDHGGAWFGTLKPPLVHLHHLREALCYLDIHILLLLLQGAHSIKIDLSKLLDVKMKISIENQVISYMGDVFHLFHHFHVSI